MRKLFWLVILGVFILGIVPAIHAGPSEQNISKRITDLQHRIDEGVRAGTLTPEENKNLQSRLDKIRERLDKAKEKRYGLTDAEATSINKQLDTLSKNVRKEKQDLQTTRAEDQITRRIYATQKRIETGNRDGSLTGSEAKSLQTRLDGIQRQFDGAKKGGLSDQEIRAIERSLEALNKDISKERHDSQQAR